MENLQKLNNCMWKINKTANMLVPTVIFSSDKMIELIKKDSTLEQGRNMATLPGIQKNALIMLTFCVSVKVKHPSLNLLIN